MAEISWLRAVGGGVLIGAAATALLLFNGRIAGISGIMGGLLPPRVDEGGWRWLFLGGLVLGGAFLVLVQPSAIGAPVRPLALSAASGLFVGFGTAISNGCTSGHGVCGLSRRSWRSLVATCTFIATGAVTVYVVEQLIPGSSP